MCGSPDVLVSSLRGVARSIDSKLWGTYVAHEWYGGMRHDDPLKRKRLELAYKYAYLAGTQAYCLESGDECIESYGHTFAGDSEICEDYRKVLCDTMELIKSDFRPKGGPKVKVAFVSGLHDAWGGWGGSSVWNGFEGEEWGHNEAEHSWRMASEIGTKRTWEDIANYGEQDLSTYPAYGMYDIIPIEAPVDKLSKYDYLIFLGWNSMTGENMDKLTEYVNRGGRLLMSVAHLNKTTVRGGALELPSTEKIEKLFGVRFANEIRRTNAGVKFKFEAEDKKILYPGSKSFMCDPIYSAGYASWAKFELCGAYETAFVSDTFLHEESDLPAVVENRVGKGIATLVTCANYPGHPALYPLYRAMVREMITASARDCEIKVLGSDRLRWSVYEGNKVYLLNTDYDMPITVKVIYKDSEQLVTLNSLEMKTIEL
ncbi:MAG: beta-galactosidase trimerization domain-containing protein, partial [Oscillospiraceae bacterium]|nr:beta-galactosidase trimerization domain-containing protein [Oscillospiraceae bacterium]